MLIPDPLLGFLIGGLPWSFFLPTTQEGAKPIVNSLISYQNSTRQSRDSSVGIVLGYGLDDRSSRVQFPAGAGNFSLHHRVQNGSGAHPASYPIGTSF
jgi:hypothetical protein